MKKQETRVQIANQETKKAFKWLLRSGSLLTALNAISAGLLSLQLGEIELRGFLVGLVFTFSFMIVNTAIYWAHEYNEAEI